MFKSQFTRKIYAVIAHLANSGPVAASVFLSVFTFLSLGLLVIGRLENTWLLSISLPVATLCAYRILIYKPSDWQPSHRNLIIDLILILYVMTWGLFNLGFTAENVFVYRDPASYAVTGAYLIENKGLNIRDGQHLFTEDQVKFDSAGFWQDPKDPSAVNPHGMHALPVLSGVAGRLTSVSGALKVNIFIGCIALLSVYSFSKKYVKNFWALVVTVGLSISMPFIFFSRDMYSEILSIALLFCAMNLTLEAIRSRKRELWVMSGIVAGSIMLARIDALLSVAPLLLTIALAGGVDKRKKQLAITKRNETYFFFALMLVTLVGLLDLVILSDAYFRDHQTLIIAEALGLLLLYCAARICVAIYIKKPKTIKKIMGRISKASTKITLCVIAALVVVVVTRPLWRQENTSVSIREIGARQVILTNPTDGSGDVYRSEVIFSWLIPYIGIPVSILGILGLIFLLRRLLKKGNIEIIMIVTVFSFGTLLYLLLPSITPDHIWAIRRFMPVSIPLFFVLSAYAAQIIIGKANLKKRLTRTAAMGLIAASLVIPPLLTSSPVSFVKTYEKQLQHIYKVCSLLPPDSVFLLGDTLGYEATHTFRAYCGVDSYRLENYSTENLKSIYSAAQRANRSVYLAFIDPQHFNVEGAQGFDLVNAHEYKDLELKLYSHPRQVKRFNRQVMLARVNSDGHPERLNIDLFLIN